jgi:hypothetical protein
MFQPHDGHEDRSCSSSNYSEEVTQTQSILAKPPHIHYHLVLGRALEMLFPVLLMSHVKQAQI